MEDSTGGGVIGPTADIDSTSARDFEPAPRDAHPTPRARMPGEWEFHDATWIAWPHHEPDWPGKLAPIPWVYAEIVRVLHRFERVEILCHDQEVRAAAEQHLHAHGVSDNYRLHLVP